MVLGLLTWGLVAVI